MSYTVTRRRELKPLGIGISSMPCISRSVLVCIIHCRVLLCVKIRQILLLARVWFKHITSRGGISVGNIRVIFPKFLNCLRCENVGRKTQDRIHLLRKNSQIFVFRHYLLLKAHSFPPATFSEPACCSEQPTSSDKNIPKHIFTLNGNCCNTIR